MTQIQDTLMKNSVFSRKVAVEPRERGIVCIFVEKSGRNMAEGATHFLNGFLPLTSYELDPLNLEG